MNAPDFTFEHNACTSATVAIKVQPDPRNPRSIYRVWTNDFTFIVLDVFIDNCMTAQHIHRPGDHSYTSWRGALLFDNSYPAWQF